MMARTSIQAWRRRAILAGVALLAIVATGCQGAIRGDWTLERASPNKHAFSIDNASFGNGDVYVATITIDGVTSQERGTYTFTGSKLVLRPTGGGAHTFPAEVKFERLEIKRGSGYTVLKKGKKGA